MRLRRGADGACETSLANCHPVCIEANRSPGVDGRVWRPPLDMLATCEHADYMSRMIQIRNVPEEIHRTLKARAAEAGMSLSDYLLAELEDAATRPSPREMRERLERRSPVLRGEGSAEAVRAVRESR